MCTGLVMMAWSLSARLFAAWAMLFSLVAAQCSGVSKQSTQKMAAGYKSSVLITGLKTPRGIAMDTQGALLVAEQNGGAVRRLTLKDSGDTVCVDTNTVLIPAGNVCFFLFFFSFFLSFFLFCCCFC